MSLKQTLRHELGLRQDCVQADFERLIEAGANRDALERIVEHSLQIGIIMDKLNNLELHEVLNGNE